MRRRREFNNYLNIYKTVERVGSIESFLYGSILQLNTYIINRATSLFYIDFDFVFHSFIIIINIIIIVIIIDLMNILTVNDLLIILTTIT